MEELNRYVMVETMPPMMSVAQCARQANVSESTIRRMCSEGDFRARKVRRTWRVDRDSFLAYLSEV